MPNLPWDEAIKQVLGEANGPLHYTEIAEGILTAGLRAEPGATPAQTVAATLSLSLRNDPQTPFQRVARGQYILREAEPQPEVVQAEAAAAEQDPVSEAGALQAFGMFWRREAVNWSKSTPPIFGRQAAGAAPVNFGDQIGVYLLHDRDRVIYVGRAADKLHLRLRAHTVDRLEGRWDRFSWFGLKGVTEAGALSGDAAVPWSHTVVIETMEALLIESLEPPLNRKRGDNFNAVEYLQVEDQELEAARKRALLEDLIRNTR